MCDVYEFKETIQEKQEKSIIKLCRSILTEWNFWIRTNTSRTFNRLNEALRVHCFDAFCGKSRGNHKCFFFLPPICQVWFRLTFFLLSIFKIRRRFCLIYMYSYLVISNRIFSILPRLFEAKEFLFFLALFEKNFDINTI